MPHNLNYLTRISKLQEKIDSLNLEAFVSFKQESRRYLTGFTGSAGIVLLRPEPLLLVDFRYTEQARQEAPFVEVREYQKPYQKFLQEALREKNIKKVGFEAHHLSVAQYNELKEGIENVEWIPQKNLVEEERLIKEDEEINAIKKAQSITEGVIKEVVCSFLIPGVQEIDVAVELEYRLKKKGVSSVAFPIIVASGERAALPHGQPTEKKLKKGELVVIDIGARVDGYVSDCTRTFILGTPGDQEKKVYNAVLEAQERAIKSIKVDLEAWMVDGIARDFLRDESLDQYFGHGLGHGIGLEVHEGPRLAVEEKTLIKENMVLTVEPGVYIPGWGGVRIEDIVVVKDEGPLNLTTLSKKEWIL